MEPTESHPLPGQRRRRLSPDPPIQPGPHVGSFATGEEALPHDHRAGTFARGEETLPHDPRPGTFATGEETLPHDQHLGTFATGARSRPQKTPPQGRVSKEMGSGPDSPESAGDGTVDGTA
jgi:hypothetical protein